jgi:hypothetical protein
VEFLKLSLLFVPPLGGGMEISMEMYGYEKNGEQLTKLEEQQ